MITQEIFILLKKSLLSKYRIGLEISMKGSNFSVDSVQLLHSKCHKITFKRDGSYIDSLILQTG